MCISEYRATIMQFALEKADADQVLKVFEWKEILV